METTIEQDLILDAKLRIASDLWIDTNWKLTLKLLENLMSLQYRQCWPLCVKVATKGLASVSVSSSSSSPSSSSSTLVGSKPQHHGPLTLKQRLDLVAFAIKNCPVESMEELLQIYSRLETEINTSLTPLKGDVKKGGLLDDTESKRRKIKKEFEKSKEKKEESIDLSLLRILAEERPASFLSLLAKDLQDQSPTKRQELLRYCAFVLASLHNQSHSDDPPISLHRLMKEKDVGSFVQSDILPRLSSDPSEELLIAKTLFSELFKSLSITRLLWLDQVSLSFFPSLLIATLQERIKKLNCDLFEWFSIKRSFHQTFQRMNSERW